MCLLVHLPVLTVVIHFAPSRLYCLIGINMFTGFGSCHAQHTQVPLPYVCNAFPAYMTLGKRFDNFKCIQNKKEYMLLNYLVNWNCMEVDLQNTSNPKHFWKYVRRKLKTKENIADHVKDTKSNIFSSVFIKEYKRTNRWGNT